MNAITSVSKFFGEYAGEFDGIYGTKRTLLNGMINKVFRKSMLLRFKKTLEGCQPIVGKTVVDIGCGPGHYAIALAKSGADKVVGIDFAESMLDLARKHALEAGVAHKCNWMNCDFIQYPVDQRFDYAIVMGVMDYIAQPRPLVEKILSVTARRAFFSFPLAGGLLGWQRQIRYRKRCPLFMYTLAQVESLFPAASRTRVSTQRIARDLLVSVDLDN